MDLDIVLDESVKSEGILGTIYYSEIMDIENEPEWETSDTDSTFSQNEIEGRVIIRENDKVLQSLQSSADTDVDKAIKIEIDKEIRLGESSVHSGISLSQHGILENDRTLLLETASEEYRLPLLKFATLIKVRDKSQKEIMDFCMELGVIASKIFCPKCELIMSLDNAKPDSNDGYAWRCHKRKNHDGKGVSKSIRTGSFFYGARLNLIDTLMIIYRWVYKLPFKWALLELDVVAGTLLEWNDFCRDVCVEICARDFSKIGGNGTIVEIEGGEYNRRRKEENIKQKSFVFVGTVDMYGGETFLRIVEKCDKNNFLEVIKSSVLPGSTVISEFCSVFKCHKDWDFVDLAKSCKYKFKDPKSSNLSKRKNFWDVIQRKLPWHKKGKGFDPFIGEFIWRKRNSCAYDKMRRFLLHTMTIYPLPAIDKSLNEENATN